MAAIKFPPGTMWWRGGIGLPGFSSAPAEFSPLDLSPALWIDPSDASTVTISGSSGAYIGADGLVCPGAANYAMTSDRAEVDITGDIEIIVKVTAADWTPAARNTIVGKGTSASAATDSYILRLNSSGTLELLLSDGTNYRWAISTVATGLADGATKWIKATCDLSNGSNSVFEFYLSDDGATWTQLGTTVTSTTIASLGNSSAALVIGAYTVSGGFPFVGTVHRAIIKNGIGGTTVFDADFEAATPFVSAFTESALGAPVYVVSSTATSATANYSYIGPLGLVSPGAASNYGSTPDLAAHRGMTTLDIIAKASLTKWGNGVGSQNLVYKAGGGAKGYALGVTSGGLLYFSNHTVTVVTSTVAVGFADGATRYVRALATQSTDVKFYTSTDGIAWTQLGTTVAYADTFAADTGTMIFGNRAGGEFLSGTLMQVQLWNGDSTSGGTKVLDADFAAADDNTTLFTESSSNAALVSVIATSNQAAAAGALVSQINDKSGNGRHLTQSTAANMLSYLGNAVNGKNAIVAYANAAKILQLPASGLGGGAQPFTIAAIQKMVALASSNFLDFPSPRVILSIRQNNVYMHAGVSLTNLRTITTQFPHIVVGQFNGVSSALRYDGAQVTTGTASTNALPSTNGRAVAGDGSTAPSGFIGELVVALGLPDPVALETYMRTKWGTP
jgi:hypothetical protein